MSGKSVLVFRNLHDNVWAAFPKRNRTTSMFHLPIIIFPKEFQPETGKRYKCRVTETAMGLFKYNNQSYRVAYAMPAEMGTEMDYLEYKLDLLEKRNSHMRKDGGETMKAAFERLLNQDDGFKKFVNEGKTMEVGSDVIQS